MADIFIRWKFIEIHSQRQEFIMEHVDVLETFN